MYFDKNQDEDFLFNNFTSLLRVVDKNKWEPKYVFYALFLNYQKGGTRKYENRTTGIHNLQVEAYLKSFFIKQLDLCKQRQIVDILDKLVDLIKYKYKQINLFDLLVKSRFIEMFGDVISNSKLWPIKEWQDVLQIINGKNQKTIEDINGIYPICGSGGIIGWGNDFLSSENSVIIGRKGNINKPILMRSKFWNVDTAFALVPNDCFLVAEYLFYFCKFFNFEKLNKTVTIPSLTKNDLLKIKIPIPPIDNQNHFQVFVNKVDKSKFLAY